MQLKLSQEELDNIRVVLRAYFPSSDYEVLAFGSRVRGATRKNSDLDLALRGPHPVPPGLIPQALGAFEESSLPYRINLVDLHAVSDAFRKIIETTGVVLSI